MARVAGLLYPGDGVPKMFAASRGWHGLGGLGLGFFILLDWVGFEEMKFVDHPHKMVGLGIGLNESDTVRWSGIINIQYNIKPHNTTSN